MADAENDAEALDLVILERTHDPMRAEMVREHLTRNGIVVATPGLRHRAMLPGVPAIEIVIRVPQRDLEEAQRLLPAVGPRVVTYPIRRRWWVAALTAVAFPIGGGHLYARAYASAAVLFTVQLVAVWAVVTDRVLVPWLVCVAVVVCDAVGARVACARANVGEPSNGWVSRGALASVLVVPLGLAALHFVAPPILAGRDGRALCAFGVRCGGAGPDAHDACLESAASVHLDGARVLPSSECIDCFASDALSCDEIAFECGDACAPGYYPD
jgi:hypothetical protein